MFIKEVTNLNDGVIYFNGNKIFEGDIATKECFDTIFKTANNNPDFYDSIYKYVEEYAPDVLWDYRKVSDDVYMEYHDEIIDIFHELLADDFVNNEYDEESGFNTFLGNEDGLEWFIKDEEVTESLSIKEQSANIEVENPGILEVPKDKNVEDLPIKHFVALANKKGLATITKALNNLQVWNKNKNPKLSKWAGDMIDKVSKRIENQKNESLMREFSSNFDGTEIDEVEFYSDDLTKFSNEQAIINAIEAGCTYPINVYDVDFELSHNIVVTYEVPEEYYNPDVIESDIIGILEKLEDKIRGAKPAWVRESTGRLHITEDYKDDLKKFADANKDELGTIAYKNGYQLHYKPYYRPTTIDGDFITVLCFDLDEVNNKADIDKLDRAFGKFFKNFDFRYFIEELPRVKRICIYY